MDWSARLRRCAVYSVVAPFVVSQALCPERPPSTPAGGSEVEVDGSERIAWDQVAVSPSELQTFMYVMYVDGAPQDLEDASCAGAPGASTYECSAPLPAMTVGRHVLTLTTRRSTTTIESEPSEPLRVIVTAPRLTAAIPLGSVAQPHVNGRMAPACTSASDACYSVEELADGMRQPAALAAAPNGPVFFTEQASTVRMLVNGRLEPDPALGPADPGRRIADLALHPDFLENGYVYVAWALSIPNRERQAQVVRYRELDSRLGQPMTVVADVPLPCSGEPRIQFGPDRELYLAVPRADVPSCDSGSPYDGLVLRFNDDGTVPRTSRLASPIFSMGHPAPTAMAWDEAASQLWIAGRADTASFPSLAVVPLRQADGRWPLAAFLPSVGDGGDTVDLPTITSMATSRSPATNQLFLISVDALGELYRARLVPDAPGRIADIQSTSFGLGPGEHAVSVASDHGDGYYLAADVTRPQSGGGQVPAGRILLLRPSQTRP